MFKKSKKDQNLKYKVRLVNTSTYEVIDDFVDDMVFETFDEAEDYALYCSSCAKEGEEILKMKDPYNYEEDYGSINDQEYEAYNIDED